MRVLIFIALCVAVSTCQAHFMNAALRMDEKETLQQCADLFRMKVEKKLKESHNIVTPSVSSAELLTTVASNLVVDQSSTLASNMNMPIVNKTDHRELIGKCLQILQEKLKRKAAINVSPMPMESVSTSTASSVVNANGLSQTTQFQSLESSTVNAAISTSAASVTPTPQSRMKRNAGILSKIEDLRKCQNLFQDLLEKKERFRASGMSRENLRQSMQENVIDIPVLQSCVDILKQWQERKAERQASRMSV